MNERYRNKSARNGFVVASLILISSLWIQYSQSGAWDFYTGSAFFLSQVAYWVSIVYYSGKSE
jgi:hypothetical protein